MLFEFCERNNLVIKNTWFKKLKRREYTGSHSVENSGRSYGPVIIQTIKLMNAM
jgi:hypothetical protein